MRVGVLHPGQMGSAVASHLPGPVGWVGSGRSAATRERAETAGLHDAGSLKRLCAESDLLMSICPPDSAEAVAGEVAAAGFAGTYLDANAIAPATADRIAGIVSAGGASYVDGGIVGPPPYEPGSTRLFLSGDRARQVAALFTGTPVEAIVLDSGTSAASALKATYAAWTKGSSALLLAVRETARAAGVEDALLAEWARSQPALLDRSDGAEKSAAAKGWRWTGEMHQIAATFAAHGEPSGFHEAAATVFGRYPRPQD